MIAPGLTCYVDPLDAPPTLIRPEVAAAWLGFSVRFEGVCRHMYLDVKGLVTTGVGNLIDPMPLALTLPWRFQNGAEAGHDDIVSEWLRVRAMKPGLWADDYTSPTGLYLSHDDICDLVTRQLEANARQLLHHYPDFATFPAAAQQALLSLAWALGAGFPPSWPRLSAAVLARDWLAAAAECRIRDDDNAGIAARNDANRALFLRADAAEEPGE